MSTAEEHGGNGTAAARDVPIEYIAETGDIVLCVGSPVESRLVVSSAILENASGVFLALLSPRFREGQSSGTIENPKAILLPGDDATVMSDMCRLLHNKTVPAFNQRKPVVSSRILAYAMAVDKYGIIDHLRLQSQALLLAWLDQLTDSCPSSLCEIAAAAYLLHQPRSFSVATRLLITNTTQRYSKLRSEDRRGVLPVSVFLGLEEKRTAAQNKIVHDLPALGMPYCGWACDESNNDSASNYDDDYMSLLCDAFSIVFWPPNFLVPSFAISNVIGGLRIVGPLRRGGMSCRHTFNKAEVTTAELHAFANELNSICQGFCLVCVKEDKEDLLRKCDIAEHENPVR